MLSRKVSGLISAQTKILTMGGKNASKDKKSAELSFHLRVIYFS